MQKQKTPTIATSVDGIETAYKYRLKPASISFKDVCDKYSIDYPLNNVYLRKCPWDMLLGLGFILAQSGGLYVNKHSIIIFFDIKELDELIPESNIINFKDGINPSLVQ